MKEYSSYVATQILWRCILLTQNNSLTSIVYGGIFMALTILFTYVFAIQTTFIRIDFAFIPLCLYAIRFGTGKTIIMATLADIIGSNLFMPGLYFPGFTLSAIVTSYIYSKFLYQQEISLKRLGLMFFAIFLIVDCILNNIWLTLMYKDAASSFYLMRIVKSIILLPIKTVILYNVYKPLRMFIVKYTN